MCKLVCLFEMILEALLKSLQLVQKLQKQQEIVLPRLQEFYTSPSSSTTQKGIYWKVKYFLSWYCPIFWCFCSGLLCSKELLLRSGNTQFSNSVVAMLFKLQLLSGWCVAGVHNINPNCRVLSFPPSGGTSFGCPHWWWTWAWLGLLQRQD